MSTFRDLYIAADAAQAVYYQQGLHPEALRVWLSAEVRYLEARGVTLFREPSVAPITPELTGIFQSIAGPLSDCRHRHYHELRVAA